MKKKLVLILAALMCISLCACGGSEANNNADQNSQTSTEQKDFYVDAETGEKVEIEINDDKTCEYYAKVKDVKTYENGTVLFQFEYKLDDTVGYSVYQTDKQEFEKGDVVKVTCSWNETDNKPSLQDIISVEKVEE